MSNCQYQSETYDSSYTTKYSPKLLPKANSQSGSSKLCPESWSQKTLSKASPQSYFRNLLTKPNPRNCPKASPQNYFQKYSRKKFTRRKKYNIYFSNSTMQDFKTLTIYQIYPRKYIFQKLKINAKKYIIILLDKTIKKNKFIKINLKIISYFYFLK